MQSTREARTEDKQRTTVREVMTPKPTQVDAGAPVTEAARAMRDQDIGVVLVTEKGQLCGTLTDRDIAVRSVAEGKDPNRMKVGEICSRDVWSVSSTEPLADVIHLMREHSVRRVPVVQDGGTPIGIVSLGDLAMRLDPSSVLGGISAAPPNH